MAYKPKSNNERVLHRLKIAKGQLENVMQMVANHTYCIDVLHQMQAVERAIAETESVVLENHLHTCVTDSIRKGKEEETIAEVMQIFKKSK